VVDLVCLLAQVEVAQLAADAVDLIFGRELLHRAVHLGQRDLLLDLDLELREGAVEFDGGDVLDICFEFLDILHDALQAARVDFVLQLLQALGRVHLFGLEFAHSVLKVVDHAALLLPKIIKTLVHNIL